MSECVCLLCFSFFKIITPYVYELLEKTCNMTRAILPVSTPSERRRLPLWFMPLKIKGSIKFENWRKCPGFRSAIMILSVVFNWKEKGIVNSHLSLFCTALCLSISVFHLLSRFLLPLRLHTSFVRKCLLNKLTVLWCVISKTQRRSLLIPNLFRIHFALKRLSSLPSWTYYSPNSSRLTATTWSLLSCCRKHLCFFFFLLPAHCPCPSLLSKVVIIFQAAVCGGVRRFWRWGAKASEPQRLRAPINHLARVSTPFIIPFPLPLVYLLGLFISLFLWKIALFCFSSCPPGLWLHGMRAFYALVAAPSTCVALNLWPEILRRLTTAKYSEREWRGKGERKGKIFSPTWLSLSARIKFSQLPPSAFMDSVCLLKNSCRNVYEGYIVSHSRRPGALAPIHTQTLFIFIILLWCF